MMTQPIDYRAMMAQPKRILDANSKPNTMHIFRENISEIKHLD